MDCQSRSVHLEMEVAVGAECREEVIPRLPRVAVAVARCLAVGYYLDRVERCRPSLHAVPQGWVLHQSTHGFATRRV